MTQVYDVEIGPARIDEVDALIAFWTTAAENDARPVDTPAAVRRLLERDPHATLVARRGARVVGSLIVGWDGWRAHLYRLAVAPDVRRQGIASRLLDEAERRLRDRGASRIDAMVLDANGEARAVWTSQGYRRQDDWSRWVRPLG